MNPLRHHSRRKRSDDPEVRAGGHQRGTLAFHRVGVSEAVDDSGRTVQEIMAPLRCLSNLVFQRHQNAMGVAVELLSSHTSGAPVVNERGEFIGFISELDILRVLEAKKDLNQLTAEAVMVQDRISVTNATSIDEAVKICP